MAKDTWPDLSTRQGFIEAIEQAGEYIRDHASNLLGEYPSLLCEFDITARFRFDAVPTVEIRREHIAAPLDEYQQRRAGVDSVEKVCRDMYREIIDHDAKHPSHYTSGGIECKDAMAAMMGTGYCLQPCANDGKAVNLAPIALYWWGCAFKYLWRWIRKNGVQDLKKCKQCIDFLIEEIEPKTTTETKGFDTAWYAKGGVFEDGGNE